MINVRVAEDVLEPAALMLSIIQNSSANELLDRKMAEYAQAVCHGRPHFHIALVQDISPNCDCHGENDAPISGYWNVCKL